MDSFVRKGFCRKGKHSKQFALVITDSFIVSFPGYKVEFLCSLMGSFWLGRLFSIYFQTVIGTGEDMNNLRFLHTIKKKINVVKY